MKYYRTFIFSGGEVKYVIISKHLIGETIKDFKVFYQEKEKHIVLDVLRHFDTKTIDYTNFIEKFVREATNALQEELGYSRTSVRIANTTRYKNELFKFLVNLENKDWGLVSWREFRRKEKKTKQTKN